MIVASDWAGATELLTDAMVIEGTNDKDLTARLQAALEVTHAAAGKEMEEQMRQMTEEAAAFEEAERQKAIALEERKQKEKRRLELEEIQIKTEQAEADRVARELGEQMKRMAEEAEVARIAAELAVAEAQRAAEVVRV